METTNREKSFWKREIHLSGKKISNKQKEAFYSDLAMLLNSGVDIQTALEISKNDKKKKEAALSGLIMKKLINGASFSTSVRDTGFFNDYEFHSIRIGEEGGRLGEVLGDLSKYFSRRIKQKRQIISVMTYPVIVMLTSVIAVVFMLKFIVPMFVKVFQRFGTDLPSLTKAILRLSNFISDKGFIILLVLISVLIFSRILKKQLWYRKFSSWLLLHIPVLGKLTIKIYTARFCQSMHFLISAKTPVHRAIELIADMIPFYPMQAALGKIEEDLVKGYSLNKGMSRFSIFDSRIVSLIKAGEEINKLEEIFLKLNTQLSDEIDHDISVFNNILEPVIIIFIGGMVGLILIAMYLPIFQLGTSIG